MTMKLKQRKEKVTILFLIHQTGKKRERWNLLKERGSWEDFFLANA